MIIEVKQASLHSPVRVGGNLGINLQRQVYGSLVMGFDTDTQQLIVNNNKEIGLIPAANVASYVPANQDGFILHFMSANDQRTLEAAPTVPLKGKIKAQVGTPTSHVFAGEKQK